MYMYVQGICAHNSSLCMYMMQLRIILDYVCIGNFYSLLFCIYVYGAQLLIILPYVCIGNKNSKFFCMSCTMTFLHKYAGSMCRPLCSIHVQEVSPMQLYVGWMYLPLSSISILKKMYFRPCSMYMFASRVHTYHSPRSPDRRLRL